MKQKEGFMGVYKNQDVYELVPKKYALGYRTLKTVLSEHPVWEIFKINKHPGMINNQSLKFWFGGSEDIQGLITFVKHAPEYGGKKLLKALEQFDLDNTKPMAYGAVKHPFSASK